MDLHLIQTREGPGGKTWKSWKCVPRAGQIAQGVKHLPQKPETPSLRPQNPRKKLGEVMCLCHHHALRRKAEVAESMPVYRAHLIYIAKFQTLKRPCLRQKVEGT